MTELALTLQTTRVRGLPATRARTRIPWPVMSRVQAVMATVLISAWLVLAALVGQPATSPSLDAGLIAAPEPAPAPALGAVPGP